MSFNFSNTGKLFRAAEGNDLKQLKYYIDTEEAPSDISNFGTGQTLAHIAARNGYLDMLKYLLTKDPSLLVKTDSEQYDVLHLAIEEGHFNMVKYLLDEFNMDVNKPSKHGWGTPLHTAVEFHRVDILKYILEEKNGDVNVLGKISDQPPIFLAIKLLYYDIVEYLMEEKKANLTIIDANKENILFEMARKNDLPFMKRMLDEKKLDFDINQQNYLGETLVHVAATMNRTKILEYVVDEKHARIDLMRRRDNMTALHCAALRNNLEVCKYLVDHGADIEAKDDTEQTPAQKASDKNLIEYLETSKVQVRNRRNVGLLYPIFESESSMPEFSIIENSSRAVSLTDVSKFLLQDRTSINAMQLQVFLMVAGTTISRVQPRSHNHSFFSSRLFLGDEMDPVALDAVHNPPDFLKR